MTLSAQLLRAYDQASHQAPTLHQQGQVIRKQLMDLVSADMRQMEERFLARILTTAYGRQL